jgi:hypothetical protein
MTINIGDLKKFFDIEVVPEDSVKTLKILVAFSIGMQICIFDILNF